MFNRKLKKELATLKSLTPLEKANEIICNLNVENMRQKVEIARLTKAVSDKQGEFNTQAMRLSQFLYALCKRETTLSGSRCEGDYYYTLTFRPEIKRGTWHFDYNAGTNKWDKGNIAILVAIVEKCGPTGWQVADDCSKGFHISRITHSGRLDIMDIGKIMDEAEKQIQDLLDEALRAHDLAEAVASAFTEKKAAQ